MRYIALVDELYSAIGARVRAQRLARDWTLDQLAASAGVSRRMVVSVEQGEANPSIGTLLRLSKALGVGLPSLVAAPEPKPVSVTRDGEAAVLWKGAHGGRAVLRAATAPPDVVELWDWVLEAGDEHTSEAHRGGTSELIHVLSGRIVVLVDDQDFALASGDSACFPGDVPHAYRNQGKRSARFSLTVFEPSVGGDHE